MGLASLTGILTVMATTMSGILAREVCYHEYNIGCFTDNAPGNALPQSPAHQQVKFLLYTKKNPTTAQYLTTDPASIKSSNFVGTKKTKFIIHGHTDTAHKVSITAIRDAFLQKEDANVFMVDWEKGADNPKDYIKSATNTRVVGALLAEFMKALHNTAGASYSDMHLVGHSLGAHVAGYAGARVKPGRITGLDPAGPFFETAWKTFRLDPSDSDFVDVIHTNGKPLIKGGAVRKVVEAVSSEVKKNRAAKEDTRKKFDSFDENLIHRTVHRLHKEKKFVSLNTLSSELRKIGLPSSFSTLRKYLVKLGFKHKKKNVRRFSKETQDIVTARHDYLRDGLDIVYLDETWVNKNHACEGGWTHNEQGPTGVILPNCEECGRHIPSGKGDRLIVLDAGSKECGFIDNVELIFPSKTKSVDYHDEMNGRHFMEWFEETLCPALDRPSVIVMDNAPYHNIKADRCWYPRSSSNKIQIINWLTERGVPVNDAMTKKELLELVTLHRPIQVFKTDDIAMTNGHLVLRLPVRHCELNPIELIQAEEKMYVARHNTTFKLADVEKLFKEAKLSITQAKWAKACDHVIANVERKFWEVDGVRREEVEPLIIHMADDSEEEDASGDEDLEEGVQEQEAAENGCGDENKDDDDDDENYGSDDGDDSDDYGGEDSDYIYDDDGEEGQIIGPGGDADRETQESVVQEDEEDDKGCAFCGCRDDDDLNAGQVQWVFCDFCDSWLHFTCDRRNDGSCQLEDKVYCCAACKKKLR